MRKFRQQVEILTGIFQAFFEIVWEAEKVSQKKARFLLNRNL